MFREQTCTTSKVLLRTGRLVEPTVELSPPRTEELVQPKLSPPRTEELVEPTVELCMQKGRSF